MITNPENSIPSIKLVFLGNSGVGKTSIINRWIIGSNRTKPNPTIGSVNHMERLTINDIDLDLFIWDTSGQEQFAPLAPLYVRSTSIAIITTDITELHSFNNIDLWKSLINNTCDDNPPIILAINKIDKGDDAIISKDEIISKYNDIFYSIEFVSAETGDGINKLFLKSAEIGLNFVLQKKKSLKNIIIISENQNNKCKC